MTPLVLDTIPLAQPVTQAADIQVAHFAFPFAFQQNTNGSIQAATVEQDSLEEVAGCVQAILVCPVGFRDELPQFGIPFPEFAQSPVDAGPIQRAVEAWEPRGEYDSREFADLASDAWRHIGFDVSVSQ